MTSSPTPATDDGHFEAEPLLQLNTNDIDGSSSGDHEYIPKARPLQKTIPQTLKQLFTRKVFVTWFIFKVLFFTQVFTAGIFIPLYGAEYFGNCIQTDGFSVSQDCVPNYTQYAFYATMFLSMEGVVTFLSSSFVGHLSDHYGRKIFFYLAIITWMLPRILMIFYVNFFLYFGVGLLQGINGGNFFIASKGYLADIIDDKEQRIIGYGFGQSSAGLGCILGAILAVAITSIWNDHTVFISLAVFYLLILVYTRFFIQESPRFENGAHAMNRSALFRDLRNPFKYLGKICQYNLILYLALLSLLMSVVESGTMSVLFSYIGNEYLLHEQGASTLVYGIYAVILSSAIMLSGFFLVLFKRSYDEINVMVIAIGIKIVALLLIGAINLFPDVFCNYVVLYLTAAIYGSSFFIWPSMTGLLTKYLNDAEQGTGFGIVDAYTAVANIFTPFTFGYLYVLLDEAGIPWILFAFAALVCVAAMLVTLGPLKSTAANQRRLLDLKSVDQEFGSALLSENNTGNGESPDTTVVL